MNRKTKFILAFILLDCVSGAGILFWCRDLMGTEDLYYTIGGVLLIGFISILAIAVDKDDDDGTHGGYG